MNRPSVLVVANSTDADPGYVGERFEDRGFALGTVLRDRLETPTEVPAGVSAVLLLGSQWSVHTPVHPGALESECALVRSALGTGVPVLALCYGAQVVAHACGGQVSAAAKPEVGLVFVDSVDEGLVPTGPWAAFHVDVVQPPPRARVVARNQCGTQAFLLPGVLAVQFHPEVRPETLEDWSQRLPALLEAAGVDRSDLVAEARARDSQARAAAHALVDAFLDSVAVTSAAQQAPPDARTPG